MVSGEAQLGQGLQRGYRRAQPAATPRPYVQAAPWALLERECLRALDHIVVVVKWQQFRSLCRGSYHNIDPFEKLPLLWE